MVFSSIKFLFYFLPVVIALYFLTSVVFKKKYTLLNLILLLSSLIFYIEGEKGLVLVMIFSGTVDYFLGLYISNIYKKNPGNEKPVPMQKFGLLFSIIINLGVLFYFKYSNFFIEEVNYLLQNIFHSSSQIDYLNVTLPLGISFYTFQSMSYTIDIYYRNVEANRNYLDYTCFITMFPQLVAGPIVRYKDIETQLRDREHSYELMASGFKRFTLGLAKKVIIANFIAYYADEIFSLKASTLDMPLAWIGAFCYSLQIYFDFSGYSDMAIGLGKIFGFHFPENFNYPYIAKSVQDFWRRWHISLSSWFRDYLYIPLGGNKGKPFHVYRNLFIVFILCGFWHGASFTFVIWGLYHGFFLVMERFLKDKVKLNLPDAIKHMYTVFVFIFGWVIFRSENNSQLYFYLEKMVSFNFEQGDTVIRIITESKFVIAALLGIIFSIPVFPYFSQKTKDRYLYSLLYLILFIICCISLIGDDYNPFIYFRF